MGEDKLRGNSFMDIVQQISNRIEWMIQDVQVNEIRNELLRESLYTLWKVYRTYDATLEGFDRYALSEVSKVLNQTSNRLYRNAWITHLSGGTFDLALRGSDQSKLILDALTVNRWKWFHCNILWGMKQKTDLQDSVDLQEKPENVNKEEKAFPDEQLEA
ncbi:hypothetical protein GCM10009001_02370 [Virgibacillus siamensis]|uniref:Uncharacterized protein n=1 Tax=Virgibacillus siamensis TaxID=480071 RepID=A0ABN1FFW1_9BACI